MCLTQPLKFSPFYISNNSKCSIHTSAGHETKWQHKKTVLGNNEDSRHLIFMYGFGLGPLVVCLYHWRAFLYATVYKLYSVFAPSMLLLQNFGFILLTF